MERVLNVVRAGAWARDRAIDTVTLDSHGRHRRRGRIETDGGRQILLDLRDATQLHDGDGLALDDGRWVAVKAATEPLTAIRASSPEALARLAWHIGNRHFPAMVAGDRILIPRDHVLEAMLAGLGAQLEQVEEPFTPEAGAYAGHSHG